MSERPLLMIPGPIEISEAVQSAAADAPDSHVSPALIASFGAALRSMRHVWGAAEDSSAIVVAGSGTLAMDMAVANVARRGDRALLVNTGYFSDRIAMMLFRRGVEVEEIVADPGESPSAESVDAALAGSEFDLLVATHVDTSTGVRVDAQGYCEAANRHDVLSVFDGVCATGGERFEMEAWGADVYLTASQKAIGLPPGLALLVASTRAVERRADVEPPPLGIDWDCWLPIMQAYEEGRPAYFATPATTLIKALEAGLDELLDADPDPARARDICIDRHARAAGAFRAAWTDLGLEMLPRRDELAANTLSAVYYPDGVDAALLARIRERGVIIAPGLHPELKDAYFRVGHMGDVTRRPDALVRTLHAIGDALLESGHDADVEHALGRFRARLAA